MIADVDVGIVIQANMLILTQFSIFESQFRNLVEFDRFPDFGLDLLDFGSALVVFLFLLLFTCNSPLNCFSRKPNRKLVWLSKKKTIKEMEIVGLLLRVFIVSEDCDSSSADVNFWFKSLEMLLAWLIQIVFFTILVNRDFSALF